MPPTLQVQDRVLVNKLSYDLHGVHRGDIIVFEGPQQAAGSKDLIKRVIGLPGETVEARDGHIYVERQAIDEPYLAATASPPAPSEPITIPPNHYWVMGDNRANSKDSRYFGAIDKKLIIGRAFVRVWPITSLGLL